MLIRVEISMCVTNIEKKKMSNIFGRIFGVFISLFPTRYIVLLLLLSYVMFYNMIYTHRFVSFALRGIYFSSRKKLWPDQMFLESIVFFLSRTTSPHTTVEYIEHVIQYIKIMILYISNWNLYFQLLYAWSCV